MISVYVKSIRETWFGVASDDKSIYATTFAFDRKDALDNLFKSIPSDLPHECPEKASHFAEQVIAAISDIYQGKDVSTSFPLAMDHLSDYAKKVIEITALIPLGYVTSYGSIAKAAGGSPRAVGRIMAMNPYAPIIPCHRVVSSDFALCGYGGGLKVKQEILKRESRGHPSKREISVNNRKLELFPVEIVLKKLEKSKR